MALYRGGSHEQRETQEFRTAVQPSLLNGLHVTEVRCECPQWVELGSVADRRVALPLLGVAAVPAQVSCGLVNRGRRRGMVGNSHHHAVMGFMPGAIEDVAEDAQEPVHVDVVRDVEDLVVDAMRPGIDPREE